MSARSPNTGPTLRGNGATVLIGTLLSIATFVTGCASVAPDPDPAWAVNVGGPAYVGVDGTAYAADSGITRGTARTMSRVLGSQDDPLYLTYRAGDLRIARPIADGTYDITFHFAEPEPFGPGERVFDVYAEKKRVIVGLDVMQSRDGKTESALTVTVPRVDVSDGTLDITFEASAGQPILSALVVRRHKPAPPS